MIEREAVRAMVLTPEGQTLLMHISDPASAATYWVCPGGGLEPDEPERAGLRRELAEELGRKDLCIGAPIYRWRHQFSWNGRRYRQTETFYVVESPRFVPEMIDSEEARYTLSFRWWDLTEIQGSELTFSPRDLAGILMEYLEQGPPGELGMELVGVG